MIKIPLICSRQGLNEELLKFLGDFREKLRIVATYDMMFNASIMARENFGCLLGYEKIVDTGKDSELKFVPLSPVQVSTMHIIWKKHGVFTPIAEKVKNRLIEYFSTSRDM